MSEASGDVRVGDLRDARFDPSSRNGVLNFDGESGPFGVGVPAEQLPSLLLAALSLIAAEKREAPGAPALFRVQGWQMGRSGDEVVLALQLGSGVELMFAFPRSEAKPLINAFRKALEAG